jgi:hypothetical protein
MIPDLHNVTQRKSFVEDTKTPSEKVLPYRKSIGGKGKSRKSKGRNRKSKRKTTKRKNRKYNTRKQLRL